MSLQSDFQRAWQGLQAAGGGTLRLPLPDGEVCADLPLVDSVGCQCRQLVVRSQRLAGLSTDQLTAIGDELARRLTYLLEPLHVIEIDGQAQVVQMRSVPPSPTPAGCAYYELLVRAGGELELVRYERAKGQQRTVTDALFTQEVLGRLIDDLVGALP